MAEMLKLITGTLAGNISLIILSFILLYYGADLLVKGSVSLALSFGVQKLIIGLTLVAFGTSMPEFMVSLMAAIQKSTGMAVGNVIGSNIFNIAFILGIASLIRPLQIQKSIIRMEIPILFCCTLLFNLLVLDGVLGFWDGIILLLIFFGYIVFRLIYEKRQKTQQDNGEITEIKGSRAKNLFIAILGIGILVLGSEFLIRGGIFVARHFQVSELVIGFTILAAGTSLPELFTSVVASIKKEADISVGNVIGSNFFNIFFVLGLLAVISSLQIDKTVVRLDNWVHLGLTIALFPIMKSGLRINRFEGAFLLIFYVIYCLNLFFKWVTV